jgi:hypothetical protein
VRKAEVHTDETPMGVAVKKMWATLLALATVGLLLYAVTVVLEGVTTSAL